jgi:hypothetical protein
VLTCTQVPLQQLLQQRGLWTAWESVWDEQQYRTRVYQLAYIPGNTRVMSHEYNRSRTRNGTRVQVDFSDDSGAMQRYACEVLRFLELQPPAGQAQDGGPTAAVMLALVLRYNTVVRTDQPQLAEFMLEAKVDDLEEQPFVIWLEDIKCALNACEVVRDGVHWLQFPPHFSMSVGTMCKLPSTVYNTY